jgi:hypothetical protein
MSARGWRARHGRLVTALCLAMAVTTGCRGIGGNVETIRYGREVTPEGDRLRVAALQPRCGCVSLANVTQERVWLESWFYSIPIGNTIVEPGERRRFLFDWSGPEAADFYEMVAFKVGQDDRGRPQRDNSDQGGLLIRDVLPEYAQLTFMSCNDTACEFGTLNMNRAFLGTGTQTNAVTRQRGVNVGSVIEVAAPLNRCGCMMTRNTSADTVTLRATLHGTESGQLTVPAGATIPIAFDWAGTLDTDQYVLEIVAVGEQVNGRGNGSVPGASNTVGGAGPRGASPPSGGSSPLTPTSQANVANAPSMTIRLRDYISIVGQLVDMDCTPDGPQFSTTGATVQQPDQLAQQPAQRGLLACPWLSNGSPGLGMFSAYDRDRTIVQPPTPPAPNTAPPVPPAAGTAAP